MNENIAVICDTQEYDKEYLLQIITKARKLGDKSNSKVFVFCVGKRDDCKLEKLIRFGADSVLIFQEEEKFDNYYLIDVVSEMIKQTTPKIILVPATTNGKFIAANISTKFEAGLTADCIDIGFDNNGEVYFERAALNDSVIAKIKCINCNMMLGTIKKDIFIKEESLGRQGLIENFIYKGHKDKRVSSWQIIESIERKIIEEVDINQYKKVFCIGRGIKSLEMRDRILRLADKMGAGLVGTRAAVEEGWIDKERQVGQSGKSISPHIYISFGVSGASQHIVGIKNADIIVAINNDKNAAIFNYADYSIVENIEDVVKEMERQLYEESDLLQA